MPSERLNCVASLSSVLHFGKCFANTTQLGVYFSQNATTRESGHASWYNLAEYILSFSITKTVLLLYVGTEVLSLIDITIVLIQNCSRKDSSP